MALTEDSDTAVFIQKVAGGVVQDIEGVFSRSRVACHRNIHRRFIVAQPKFGK